MGEYLSVPIREKDSEDNESEIMKYGACGMQGWRKGMEDSHITNLKVCEGISLFGVFDGHGGKEVAYYVRAHLVEELVKLDSFKKGDYPSALTECFLKIDVLITTEEGRKELSCYAKGVDKNSRSVMSKQDEDIAFYAGCTAVVALITKTEIYCANSGDSRCVISKKGTAVGMSEDHKPENPLERKRIEKAGGFVEDNRVNGILNLSRSLGDLEYKTNSALGKDEQMITAVPEIRIEKLTPDIDFIILACDGIWDCLTNQQAVDFVAERLAKARHDKEYKISKIIEGMFDKIVAPDVASSGGIGCDNMTCVVVNLKK